MRNLNLGKKKILVIDDFLGFRRTMKKMLRSLGAIDIDEAKDGDSAISMMQDTSYDIVFSDDNLGESSKDGQQILEEVKARELLPASTIYMMITAESAHGMIMGAVDYAPDEYLIKPFTEAMVEKRLEVLLELKNDLNAIERSIKRKEYKKAISLADEKIATKSKNILQLLKVKGELCLEIGDFKNATDTYNKILSMRNISWAKLGLGRIEFAKGNYDEARALFDEIVNENKAYIAAYDWLAKALSKLGQVEEAKMILSDATELSPGNIPRQRALAGAARETGDLEKAEKALKKTVALGKKSYLKEASDYTGLANVLIEKDSPDEALSVAAQVRDEFKGNHEAVMQAAMAETKVYKKMGKDTLAQNALEEASKLQKLCGDNLSKDVSLGLAKTYFEMGDKEKGAELMQNVVGNNHDDAELLDKAMSLFMEAGLLEEGEKILSSAIGEVKKINDEGIKLLQQSQFAQGIDFFKSAAAKLPKNKVLNANVAHALLLYMEQNGKNRGMLDLAKQHLEKVKLIDPSYQRVHKLRDLWELVSSS